MKLKFITTNKHKFAEVKDILAEYGVTLEQLNLEYEENHDEDSKAVVRSALKNLASRLDPPFVIEDTGIFFEAYSSFPGALPKYVFNSIGYDGIFRLLKGKDRRAYFKSIVGYCGPKEKQKIFNGILRGAITKEIHNPNKDRMPYERIFIPEGMKITASDMTLEEKNTISHRAIAFRKLGEYLKGTNE